MNISAILYEHISYTHEHILQYEHICFITNKNMEHKVWINVYIKEHMFQ